MRARSTLTAPPRRAPRSRRERGRGAPRLPVSRLRLRRGRNLRPNRLRVEAPAHRSSEAAGAARAERAAPRLLRSFRRSAWMGGPGAGDRGVDTTPAPPVRASRSSTGDDGAHGCFGTPWSTAPHLSTALAAEHALPVLGRVLPSRMVEFRFETEIFGLGYSLGLPHLGEQALPRTARPGRRRRPHRQVPPLGPAVLLLGVRACAAAGRRGRRLGAPIRHETRPGRCDGYPTSVWVASLFPLTSTARQVNVVPAGTVTGPA